MAPVHQTRRGFFRQSAAAGAALLAAPACIRGANVASERIRVAVVGVGGRARNHIAALEKIQGVEIAALCDVYEPRLQQWAEHCSQASGKRPATYVDYRKLLEDDSIDAVTLVTPDHWHALQTIWACQAGKNVYCEKVGAHNLIESRRMLEATRKFDRIVQHGTQARSSPNIREGIEKLQQGVIGRIYMARAVSYKLRAGGKNEFAPVPKGLDWDLWQGPAPAMPFNKLAFSSRWRYVKEYGNGALGAQGVHQLDMIRWALKLDRHPTTIQALGGNYSRPTSDETQPTEMTVTYQFEQPKVMVTFETRANHTNPEAEIGTKYMSVEPRQVVGVVFFGSEGYMTMPNFSSYYTFLGPERQPGPSADDKRPTLMDNDHFVNWIAALRSRDRGQLTAEFAEGHLSSSLIYLGKIAYETGRTVKFDSETEKFVGDDHANRLLTREYRPPFTLPRL
jgi:predicted dehydrogenase